MLIYKTFPSFIARTARLLLEKTYRYRRKWQRYDLNVR